MRSLRKRVAYFLLFTAALVITVSIGYDFGMRAFEPGPYPPPGTEISLLHSMQVVVETITATGYGSDAPWTSPEMNTLIILLDLTGVGLFFLALPAVLLPVFRDALSTTVPTAVDDDCRDHIVICSYTNRVDALIDELTSNDIEYVLLEPDRDRAVDLYEDGYSVVDADPQSVEALEAANLPEARALVADVSDRVDASIVLTAKEAAEDVPVVSVVEDPELVSYHELAGADHVVTPRRLLGEGLASKVTTEVETDLGDSLQLGSDFEIAEISIRAESELAGRTLGDSEVRERYGVNVVGAWANGEFETPPPLSMPLERGTTLLVTGETDALRRLRRATGSRIRQFGRGETIVVGYGQVGQTVSELLAEADISQTVIDSEAKDGVDVVGDATVAETFRNAGITEAQSVVIALPDETDVEFATLIVRDIDPETEIIARAETNEAVSKTYRAGADYVLSLATVSGRSIASLVIDDEEILGIETNVEIIKTTAPGLAGETLNGARIRERTGCTVVAVERDDATLTDLDADFRIEAGDRLVIAGSDSGVNTFLERYC
ncbi:TrkA family potassium uptake protein [Halonotius terrestris]|uniref:TrkA family potassium uptake protein n=1 Tax=Halonotius terrestris TaxID=2487750 RepID=A0A8J8P8Y8_9EURY|nr:NAD-binding protein [Halonotius terrestris]TQQ81214.1 TrkA family potassium uptake protein [Halonotius terrestris]